MLLEARVVSLSLLSDGSLLKKKVFLGQCFRVENALCEELSVTNEFLVS